MKIKVSDYIAEFLSVQQVGHVFEVAGGMITQMLDAIHQQGDVKIVSVHHEQAAAFSADAYGRRTANVGVAFATSGPGATNLLTGIASCYYDSSPALFITGQVNTHEQKGNRKIRQLGFQETDIISMLGTITKKCYQITDANQVESVLKEAYQIAISDRPGPVLIDIPMNMQKIQIDVEPIQKINKKSMHFTVDETLFDELFAAIKTAKRPLLLVGGGINIAAAAQDLVHLSELLQVPVVTSLLGVDIISFDHPLRAGFIGSYGNRWANMAIGQADLLIVIGSRLDIRQTGADVASFSANKKIFHIDADVHEINNRLKNCIPMLMDAAQFIKQMVLQVPHHQLPLHTEWQAEIKKLQREWPDTQELKGIQGINPNVFMHQLSAQSSQAIGYVVDVGNHQMWAAQSLEIRKNQFFMTSGGLGAMGFALPAAIGAAFAHSQQPVVVIAGDGGFQMNIQELQTIVRNKLPIKIVIINNNSLGMIRQFQDNYFEGRYQSTCWGYSAPNFELIAGAYGLAAKTIALATDIEAGASWLWENNEAALLQVMVDTAANAYPKIAFGKPITEMEPFSKPMSMEAT